MIKYNLSTRTVTNAAKWQRCKHCCPPKSVTLTSVKLSQWNYVTVTIRQTHNLNVDTELSLKKIQLAMLPKFFCKSTDFRKIYIDCGYSNKKET